MRTPLLGLAAWAIRPTLVVVTCLLGTARAPGGPAQVILVRHAEKPAEGPELSLKGRQRAAALVPYFLETPEVVAHGPPAAVYAQKSTEQNPSRRPVETVKGLAQALKLEVQQYPHEDYRAMVQEIKSRAAYEGKTVVICWAHQALPRIAEEFGVKNPPDWPREVYDRTWVITFRTNKTTLKNLPQRLMYGDAAE